MKKHSIIKQYLFSYLILLIIPLISAAGIYWQTSNMVENDTIISNRQSLKDSVEILDRELANLDYTVKRLIMDQDVNTFLNTTTPERGSPDFMNVIRASYAVYSYRVNPDFLADFFIYSRINNIIITTGRVHTEIENDYPVFFCYGDMSFDEWKSNILDSYHHFEFLPSEMVMFSGKQKCVIPFIQSVPFNNRKYFQGNIIGYIDAAELHELLGRLNRDGAGCVYLIDKKDDVLTMIGECGRFENLTPFLSNFKESVEKQVINGEEWIVSRASSNITGLRILSILPHSIVNNKIFFIKKIIFIVTLILLSFGMIVALLLAYWNSKPLIEITDIAKAQLANTVYKGNDLDYIKNSMKNLIRTNKELADYKSTQLPITRKLFLDRFMRGFVSNTDNIETFFRYNEIDLGDPPYNVVIFSIGGFGSHINDNILIEKELMFIIIEDLVQKKFPENGYFIQMDQDILSWIYNENNPKSVKQALTEISITLKNENMMETYAARGCPRRDLKSLPESWKEAFRGMEYLLTINRDMKLCNFDELPEMADSFFYNLDLEARLVLYVKTGKMIEMLSIMDEIFEENFNLRELSVEMINRLLESLLNTLIRINEFFLEDGLSDFRIKTISSRSSAIDEFQEIRGLFTSITLKIAGIKDDELKNLRRAIMDYIDKTFSNPGLNLFQIAEEFGYKESYLYHFFNDFIGCSFAFYLESVRLQQACEYLVASEGSIDEIAEKTGYSSSHSFRRAFKRKYKVSPSLYEKTYSLAES